MGKNEAAGGSKAAEPRGKAIPAITGVNFSVPS